jgi:phage tail P2-like protein
LEQSFNTALYSITHQYPQLLSGQDVNIKYLPHLAIEKQVAVYSNTFTDQIKRDVTDSAWQVRRKSGTRKGVQLALKSLGFSCEFISWHEQSPQAEPYSFILWAYSEETLLTADIGLEIDILLEQIKSERDSYLLKIARGSNNYNFISSSLEIGTTITSEPFQSSGCNVEASTYNAACVHAREIVTTEPALQ